MCRNLITTVRFFNPLSDYDSGCCTVVLLAGSVCAHPAWNMVCDNNVLGDKVEKLKKKNDVQTYREIVAFTEGKKLDEISKMVEGGKRPYQNVFKFVFGAAIAVVVLMLGEVLIRFIG